MVASPVALCCLGLLLATTYTVVGLLSLWAATSKRHWLLRWGVVLLAISPLLAIPACEAWIVLAFQACVIVLGVRVWQWTVERRRRGSREASTDVPATTRRFTFRFSIRSLLALTVLVAALTAIGVRVAAEMPVLNLPPWLVLLHGLSSGCSVLLAAWLLTVKRKWISWVAASLLCLVIAVAMVRYDLFFSSVVDNSWAWFVLMPAIMIGSWILAALWLGGTAIHQASGETIAQRLPQKRWKRIAGRTLFCFVMVALAAFPGFVLCKLLHPLPLPIVPVPNPNGFDDIEAATNAFDKSPILSGSVKPNSTKQLAAEIAKYSAAYNRLHLGLSREMLAQAWPKEDSPPAEFWRLVSSGGAARSAARALCCESQWAEQQNRPGDAARIAVETIRLGQAVRRNGVVVDYLVGVAVEGVGDGRLYQVVPQLSAEQCRETIDALSEIDQQREPLDKMLRRDRAWDERAFGWIGHLCLVLEEDISSTLDPLDAETTRLIATRNVASTRLLMVELALRAFHLDHGTMPDRLDQLVPKYLKKLPVDPFDPQGRPFRFLNSGKEVVVYSVGADGDDDNGRPLAKDEYGYHDPLGEGDIRLDTIYAPEDESEATEDGEEQNDSGEETSDEP